MSTSPPGCFAATARKWPHDSPYSLQRRTRNREFQVAGTSVGLRPLRNQGEGRMVTVLYNVLVGAICVLMFVGLWATR